MKKQISIVLVLMAISFQNTYSQDGRFDVWKYDIQEAIEDAKIYTNPQERQYIVRPAHEPWLGRAISAKWRNDWAAETSMSADQKKQIYAKLDELKLLASKKLPLHVPGPERFAFGTKEELDLLREKITDLSELTVHKIGLQDKNWIIERDDYGNITGRRKWGYMWIRAGKPGVSDHPYCRTLELYLYQPYQGGGSYGEAYGTFERKWLCGCPK